VRCLALIVAAACCVGCVKPIPLSSGIQPSRALSDKSSEKAGVVCSENLLRHVERASPSTLAGFATTYELELGAPLCNALTGSVEGSYRAAQRAASPHKGQYGRVVKFDLQSSSLHILPQPRGASRVAYTVSVVVERYGRDMERQSRNVVTATKLVDCRDVTNDIVREAVEAALQQVADDTWSLLVARLDGPRQHGGSAGPVPATPER
jgi:hypothetical protein